MSPTDCLISTTRHSFTATDTVIKASLRDNYLIFFAGERPFMPAYDSAFFYGYPYHYDKDYAGKFTR